MPVLRSVMRFAGSSTTPPPHATTAGSWVDALVSTAASSARNAGLAGVGEDLRDGLSSRRSISASRSTNGTPSRSGELAAHHGLARARHPHQVHDHGSVPR